MNNRSHKGHLLLPGLLLLLGLLASACDTTECGEGTHEEQGECVPNIPINCNGDGVVFRDGRCQPSSEVCGPGTEFDTESQTCIGTGGPVADTDVPDTTTGDDTGGNDDTGGDVDPDLPEAPSCGESSPDGTVCISGRVLNWLTGQPLTGSEPVGLALDDLTLRTVAPDKAPFAVAGMEEGGTFVMENVSTTSDDGPLSQMIIVVDEPDAVESDDFQRTLTGLPGAPDSGSVHPNTTVFSVPSSAVDAWSTALSLSGDDHLANAGLLLVRVLDNQAQPISGATVRNTNPTDDEATEKYYFTADMSSFTSGDTASTSANGGVLLVGAPIGQYTADKDGYQFVPTLGGAFAEVAVTTAILAFRISRS